MLSAAHCFISEEALNETKKYNATVIAFLGKTTFSVFHNFVQGIYALSTLQGNALNRHVLQFFDLPLIYFACCKHELTWVFINYRMTNLVNLKNVLVYMHLLSLPSLRSKRFQSSYSAKVRARALPPPPSVLFFF